MTAENIQTILLKESFKGGDKYATIYNKVALYMYEKFSIRQVVFTMLVASFVYNNIDFISELSNKMKEV